MAALDSDAGSSKMKASMEAPDAQFDVSNVNSVDPLSGDNDTFTSSDELVDYQSGNMTQAQTRRNRRRARNHHNAHGHNSSQRQLLVNHKQSNLSNANYSNNQNPNQNQYQHDGGAAMGIITCRVHICTILQWILLIYCTIMTTFIFYKLTDCNIISLSSNDKCFECKCNYIYPNKTNSTTHTPTHIPTTTTKPTPKPTPTPTETPTKRPTGNNNDYNLTRFNYGDYKLSAQSGSHQGWLLCDGTFQNKSKYPQLFNVIKYSFGNASNKSMDLFRLPHANGVIPGIIGSSSSYSLSNKIYGSETITLSIDNMPQHSHFVAHNGTDSARVVNKLSDYDTMNGDFNTKIMPNNSVKIASNTYSCSTTQTQGKYLENNYCSVSYNGLNFATFTLFSSDTEPNMYQTSQSGQSTTVDNMQPTLFVGNLFIYAGLDDE